MNETEPERGSTSGTVAAPGQKVSSYTLVEKLGAGGLGEVWKARDARLNRVVALKFITGERTASRELLREARAASALNHPNIVTIFEVGESEGRTYLAMEFIEGETLRARMKRAPVPLEETLDIADQVATGLAAAHRQGIIHRDLKPENIML
ncbi:MAG: serine/threonine-protein kinase, partial [Gammaproteobacteria bacterium]